MRKRTIDTDKLQTILNNISKKMNIESQMQLGLELDEPGHLKFDELISIDKIILSIKQMKLAKAPGIDGFSIEMYEILLLDDDKDILANWLQAIYRHAYVTGKLGASFPETPWLRVRRAGLCRGRPGGYAFGKVPQGGPRSHIGLRRALS